MREETEERVHEATREEIDQWRMNFLEEAFSGHFKFIPENHKNKLRSYFLSIPTRSFTTPWNEWNKCISTLLQNIGENK